VCCRHHECGRDSFVRHVANDDADLPVGQIDEVVEVAPDLSRGLVEGGDLPAGEVRELLGEELLLDELCDPEFLFEPFTGPDLGLLLLDELSDPKGGSRVRGEGVEELAVITGVLAFAPPGAEIQEPDQLPLANEATSGSFGVISTGDTWMPLPVPAMSAPAALRRRNLLSVLCATDPISTFYLPSVSESLRNRLTQSFRAVTRYSVLFIPFLRRPEPQ